MSDKLSKVISVLKKDGLVKAGKKIIRYTKTELKKRTSIEYKIDFNKNKNQYIKLIDSVLSGEYERILIWRSSFGWDVPLFQRPQHISNALSKKKCLVFYEVTTMTDDVKAISLHRENLVLVNFNNKFIYELLFSRLDKIEKPKYLQFYSTDWSMTLDYVLDFKNRGYSILYEYIDDLNPSLAGTKELPKNVADKYNWVMSGDDTAAVVVTADLLLQDTVNHRGNKNIAYSANGVDYDYFCSIDSSFEFDEDFKNVLKEEKTLVGYYGAMAKWLDYDLIRKIDATDKYSIVLFGIRYDDSLDKSEILKLKNVHFMGPRDYKVLKNYAAKLDILTIPFVINDITQATSPLKLFEYMALHKPIVTSAMNECKKFKTPLIAENSDDFIKKLEIAKDLSVDSAYIDMLDKEAQDNSWNAKADIILSLLEEIERK